MTYTTTPLFISLKPLLPQSTKSFNYVQSFRVIHRSLPSRAPSLSLNFAPLLLQSFISHPAAKNCFFSSSFTLSEGQEISSSIKASLSKKKRNSQKASNSVIFPLFPFSFSFPSHPFPCQKVINSFLGAHTCLSICLSVCLSVYFFIFFFSPCVGSKIGASFFVNFYSGPWDSSLLPFAIFGLCSFLPPGTVKKKKKKKPSQNISFLYFISSFYSSCSVKTQKS